MSFIQFSKFNAIFSRIQKKMYNIQEEKCMALQCSVPLHAGCITSIINTFLNLNRDSYVIHLQLVQDQNNKNALKGLQQSRRKYALKKKRKQLYIFQTLRIQNFFK